MSREELDLYDQILLIALHNKKYPTTDYQHRCLARWFSHTLNTPYNEALKLTFEDLMLHKLEWVTDEYSEKQADSLFKKRFVVKKEELTKEEKQEKADLDWALAQQEKALKEAEQKAKAAGLIKEVKIDKPKAEVPAGTVFPPDIKKTF